MFGELVGAYRLGEQGGVECPWCDDLFSQPNGEGPGPVQPAGAGGDLGSQMLRLRLAMLPVSVLTVTAAVLVGMLG